MSDGLNPSQGPNTAISTETTPVAPVAPVQGAQPVADPNAVTPPVDPNVAPANAVPDAGLVTPPVVEPTVLNDEIADDGTITYEETGNPALDVALGFLGGLGFAGEDPAMVAAAKGDFSVLEAKLAAMGDKARGWERMIGLAKEAFTKSEADRAASHKATEAAILSVAGSAEAWNEIKAWAGANADPAEKKAINTMIDGGPVMARAAALLLRETFSKANGTVVNPANPARDAASSASTSSGPLSRQDYAAQVRELRNKLGSEMEHSREYADLQRRIAR